LHAQTAVSDSARTDTVLFTTLHPDSLTPTARIDSLIAYAFSFEGRKYRRGGTTLNGFDCSGFTMTVFGHFGIKLPHTSAGQGLVGVEVPVKQISKGDLIFFRGRNAAQSRIGHVGIVITEKDEHVKFIHSSTTEGVRVDRMDAPYYKKRYVKTMRMQKLYQH
jgi:cell wall-associated NlpC family hydrolase